MNMYRVCRITIKSCFLLLIVFFLLFLLIDNVQASSKQSAKMINMDTWYEGVTEDDDVWYKFNTKNDTCSYLLTIQNKDISNETDNIWAYFVDSGGNVIRNENGVYPWIDAGEYLLDANKTYYVSIGGWKHSTATQAGVSYRFRVQEFYTDYTYAKQLFFTNRKAIAYSGMNIIPQIEVKNRYGKKLRKGIDYTIQFSQNRTVGKALYYISGKGKYKYISDEGSFYIIPDKVKIIKRKAWSEYGKTRINFKIWNKFKKYTYIQVSLSSSKTFDHSKKAVIRRSKIKKRTVKIRASLKKGKKYYVRIRAVKKSGSKTYKGLWSKTMVVRGK